MQDLFRDRLERCLQIALVAAAAFFIGAYIYIALSRLNYPYELEWNEGASLLQVQRLLAGQPLYTRPTLDYVALLYPALYFYTTAAMAKLVGGGFLPLRLVSFLTSLGCFGLIFAIVQRETRDRWVAFIATGLFAALFRLAGAWFDIARVDTLFLFFVLAALACIRRDTTWSYATAGLCWALAFLTKQTALLAGAPVIAACLLLRFRRAALMGGVAVLVAGAVTFGLNAASGGWYDYLVFYLPHLHKVSTYLPPIATFWWHDTLAPLPVACALTAASLLGFRWLRLKFRDAFFFAAALAAMLLTSWSGRLNTGGYNNVLFPAYALLAIIFGISLHQTVAYLPVRGAAQRRGLVLALYALCALQFALLYYPIARQIPSRADRRAGDRLVREIAAVKGEVYVPYHGYLAVLAGKHSFAHQMAVGEFRGDFGGGDPAMWRRWHGEAQAAFSNRVFGAIILDNDPHPWLQSDIEAYYVLQRPAFTQANVFIPVTGWGIRPTYVYYPKPPSVPSAAQP